MTDHHIHPDPAVRALVERAKAVALREAAAALYAGEGPDVEAYADDRFGDWLRARADSLAVQPAPTDDALCADCGSLMVEDNGAGYLCPTCEDHANCDDFPCSGEAGSPCRLRAPLTDLLAAQPASEAATIEEVAHRWDDDPNHPEGFDCDGYPLSSGERCGGSTHRPHPAVGRRKP